MDYVHSLGVVVYRGENALEALRRHADDYDWKQGTLKKHERRLIRRIAESVEQKLDSLDFMNFALEKYGLEPEYSKNKARRALESLYVNIFDFEAGIYVDLNSLQNLRRYTRENGLIYPKEKAKGNGFRVFLKKLF